jgi:hypothetical protein
MARVRASNDAWAVAEWAADNAKFTTFCTHSPGNCRGFFVRFFIQKECF